MSVKMIIHPWPITAFFAFLHPDKRTNYKKSKVYERYTECKNSVLATGQEIDLPK